MIGMTDVVCTDRSVLPTVDTPSARTLEFEARRFFQRFNDGSNYGPGFAISEHDGHAVRAGEDGELIYRSDLTISLVIPGKDTANVGVIPFVVIDSTDPDTGSRIVEVILPSINPDGDDDFSYQPLLLRHRADRTILREQLESSLVAAWTRAELVVQRPELQYRSEGGELDPRQAGGRSRGIGRSALQRAMDNFYPRVRERR